jgi:hypothetical protein
MNYDKWLASVERSCEWKFGLSVHDVPDFTWRDCFETGMSEDEAIAEFIEENPEFDI